MPEHPLRTVRPATDADGPTHDYRGAVILSNKQGTNLTFSLEGFPHGKSGRWSGIGNVAEIRRVVDAWLDQGRLPAPYVMAADR
jgi:hypothetical protein